MGDSLVEALLMSWAGTCVDNCIKPEQAQVLADDIVNQLRAEVATTQAMRCPYRNPDCKDCNTKTVDQVVAGLLGVEV